MMNGGWALTGTTLRGGLARQTTRTSQSNGSLTGPVGGDGQPELDAPEPRSWRAAKTEEAQEFAIALLERSGQIAPSVNRLERRPTSAVEDRGSVPCIYDEALTKTVDARHSDFAAPKNDGPAQV